MSKNTILILLLLSFLALGLGLNYYFKPFYKPVSSEQTLVTEKQENSSASTNLSATEIVFERFSTQDKIGQVMAWPVEIAQDGQIKTSGITEAEYLSQIAKKSPGLVTLFGKNISTEAARLAIEKITGHNGAVLPTWIAVDHEGGQVQRLNGDGFTKLASWRSMCNTDRDQSEKVLTKSAQELSEIGVQVVLGPVLDVGLPKGAMGDRLCSNKPDLIIDRVNTYLQVFGEKKILPVVKHFPGIGKVVTDLHQNFAVTRVGVEDVYVYRTILDKNQTIGVMTAHVGLENQFAHLPCSLSQDCVGELSSNYQQVLVFADALEMKSAAYQPTATSSGKKPDLSLAEISQKALLAGNNVLLYGAGVTFEQLTEVYDMLIKAYLNDPIFKEKVDVSVKKIIDYKLGVIGHETQPSSAN